MEFSVEEITVAKRGYFVGYYDKSASTEDHAVWKYSAHRNSDSLKRMAEPIVGTAYGPFLLFYKDEVESNLADINKKDWDGPNPAVYTLEAMDGGMIFFSNHIPDLSAEGIEYVQIADHTQCTEDHCTNE